MHTHREGEKGLKQCFCYWYHKKKGEMIEDRWNNHPDCSIHPFFSLIIIISF